MNKEEKWNNLYTLEATATNRTAQRDETHKIAEAKRIEVAKYADMDRAQ